MFNKLVFIIFFQVDYIVIYEYKQAREISSQTKQKNLSVFVSLALLQKSLMCNHLKYAIENLL